ncbi:MAG: hypothetical protein U1F57_05360 [bacterium]
MVQITGKTIYVLGAGASHHTGAPLLRDFLVNARLLLEVNESLVYKKSFENVFKWIDGLRGSSYYVELDLDNLEHVFSIAEMMNQLDLKDGTILADQLRQIILETLDKCRLEYRNKNILPDNVYKKFSENLKDLNKKRMQLTKQAFGSFENDTIITFNYDVMLDYAMRYNSIEVDYCINTTPLPDRFRMLKLHGSTNWAYCPPCFPSMSPNVQVQLVPASPISKGQMLPPLLEDGEKISFKMSTEILKHTKCNQCQKTSLIPLIIPPTWSKAVGNLPIFKVWKQAIEEIKTASQIIVIGYSMPQTDTFFQYLLALGLAENPRFHRVVVVNFDDSEVFKERYRKVFSRSLMDRGRLKFLTGISFQEFVHDPKGIGIGMNVIGSSLDWDCD